MTAAGVDNRPRRAVPLRSHPAVVLVLLGVMSVLAFGWPLLVDQGALLDDATVAPLVLGVVLLGALVTAMVAFGEDGLDVRALAMLGLLAAVGAVLRPLSAGSAGIETVLVLLVLGGRVFGAGFGFLLGSTTLFASAILTGGVGPWLPFQMLAAGWVGLGAGLLPRRTFTERAQERREGTAGQSPRAFLRPLGGRAWPEIVMLCGYGAVAALLFGLAMNMSFWPFAIGVGSELSYVAGAPVTENLQRFITFSLATSLGWDIGRAITTAVGIAVLGPLVLPLLRRAATRARFTTPS